MSSLRVDTRNEKNARIFKSIVVESQKDIERYNFDQDREEYDKTRVIHDMSPPIN